MKSHLDLQDELAAAQWAVTRLNLIIAALIGVGIVFAFNDWIVVFLITLAPAGWLFFSIRPALMDRLAYRKQYLHFAQMTENIVVFSQYEGDQTVVSTREFAIAWLKITGNTNVKVLSAIYEDTRNFVQWIDEKGNLSTLSFERLPTDFRCSWERWEVICKEFKDKIDRQLIESHRAKDNDWVDQYMMKQIPSDQIKILLHGNWGRDE